MYFRCHQSCSWVFNFWLGQDLISLMYVISVYVPYMSYCALFSLLGYTAHTSLQHARVLLLNMILISSLINSIFSQMFKPTSQWALLNAPVSVKSLYLVWALWRPSGSNRAPGLIKDVFFQNSYLFLVELFSLIFSGLSTFPCCMPCSSRCVYSKAANTVAAFWSVLGTPPMIPWFLWLLTILFHLTCWYPPENGLDKTSKALSCLEPEPPTLI